MYRRPRIILTLLIEDGNLVKTVKFNKPNYLGDPVNALKIFNEKGVDEVCILDIRATVNKAEPDWRLLSEMASQAFMPLSYGGGIKTVGQMRQVFRMGFEKVVVNSGWFRDAGLVQAASAEFGSQSIIVSIDYKRILGGISCFTEDGNIKHKADPLDFALRAQQQGAGEILLYSMERDGTWKGYDLDMIRRVSGRLTIPLIACGGARGVNDLADALDAGADAVAAGSMFVYFGNKNAVLIHYPSLADFVDCGIYEEEILAYEL